MIKPNEETQEVVVSEADIDVLLDEFEGNAREAIRALLQDIDTLARDHAQAVSMGYVRGHLQVVK